MGIRCVVNEQMPLLLPVLKACAFWTRNFLHGQIAHHSTSRGDRRANYCMNIGTPHAARQLNQCCWTRLCDLLKPLTLLPDGQISRSAVQSHIQKYLHSSLTHIRTTQ